MPWVISFAASWVLFFILVDRNSLEINIFGGLLTLVLATIVDWGGQHLVLYEFNDLIIPWFGCSAFYKFGPIFTMGILFSQYFPEKIWMQTVNIFVFSFLFIFLEYLIILTHVAKYIHWNILASFFIDILAFSSLSWFTISFLKNRKLLSFLCLLQK